MKFKFRLKSLDTAVVAAIIGFIIMGIALLYWAFRANDIVVTNDAKENKPVSALTGLPCDNATRRPIAVMLASDPEARPLSGIGQADMVFEMPVTPNGITRMMAVYQCGEPTEIGSIRSARQDFIPLAQGLDAILAHWGGEKDALDALNNHIIDNIDALKYESSTFYRKKGVPRPHNGFTSPELLWKRASDLVYRASTSMPAYPHTDKAPGDAFVVSSEDIIIDWPQRMNVRFVYDPTTKTYARWRGGTREIDADTGAQVRVATVIVMETDASFLRDQYITVRTTGTGTATLWQQGRTTSAVWKKQSDTAMLTFTDSKGTPIPLSVGSSWIIVDAPLPTTR